MTYFLMKNRPGFRRFPRKSLRKFIYERDGFACRYCGQTVVIRGGSDSQPDTATIDHVIPWTKGGSTKAGNLVTACFTCNRDKGDALPTGEPAAVTLADVFPQTGD